MQQRQPRLGDILDDYCPSERRVTNHAVVAMIGVDIKRTRCTTCDAEHEYKHARLPRPRKKTEVSIQLPTQSSAPLPKKVRAEPESTPDSERSEQRVQPAEVAGEWDAAVEEHVPSPIVADGEADESGGDGDEDGPTVDVGDGPVHRPLIRATLPRQEGQPPPARQAPDFTIRQPAGRQNRFRPHQQWGSQPFQGNRNARGPGGSARGGPARQPDGRPPATSSRPAKRHGPGRKRSK